MINMYADSAHWLIIHSFPGNIHDLIFKVNKKYLHKILWRTWGHDVGCIKYIKFYSENIIKDFILKIYSIGYYIIHRILFSMAKKRIKKIYAVGIANVIDAINVRDRYDLTKTYHMSYQGKEEYNILQKLSKKEDDGYYHVMIGHSGFSNDRHCDVLKLLKQFEEEDIIIHLVLSYGDEDYIINVKRFAKEFWQGNIEILEDTINYEEYAKYMNKMDAVILDGEASYALGNLGMLLFLRKKIFLNRNGVLKKGLIEENIHFHYTDEILNMSFKDFTAKEEYTIPEDSTLIVHSYEECVGDWKKIFRELDSVHKNG